LTSGLSSWAAAGTADKIKTAATSAVARIAAKHPNAVIVRAAERGQLQLGSCIGTAGNRRDNQINIAWRNAGADEASATGRHDTSGAIRIR